MQTENLLQHLDAAYADFPGWWSRYVALAEECNWFVSDDPDSYREYYEDGDTPEEALAEEMSYCDDGEDF